jgi:hypothetical protein
VEYKSLFHFLKKFKGFPNLGNTAPEGLAVGIDVDGMLLHDAEVPDEDSVLRIRSGRLSFRILVPTRKERVCNFCNCSQSFLKKNQNVFYCFFKKLPVSCKSTINTGKRKTD